ncbi:hypothetical protein PISMIDRAFT_690152 [Pisolithus microcarpus 441]|uniref:Uncharacterized protein n=1 Tax=Pisolithus microcarpus 441 TaxID=765257 RepID=A0A0C9YN54_9AGAM|nr:hypothetical protein PISMIDRAFT_690152 [Pisolithus microcarpus 441]
MSGNPRNQFSKLRVNATSNIIKEFLNSFQRHAGPGARTNSHRLRADAISTGR